MKVTLFFVLIAIAATLSQDTIFVIDDFTAGAGNNGVTIILSSSFEEGQGTEVDQDSFTASNCAGENLVGCSRDMRVTVLSGFSGRAFTSAIFENPPSAVFPAEWAISNPKTSSSICEIQYDGIDNTFNDALANPGLNGFDVTQGGRATDIALNVVSDLPAVFEIYLYDGTGAVCEYDVDIEVFTFTPGEEDYDRTRFEVDIFNDATVRNCDLTSINTIEFSVTSNDALDVQVKIIEILGIEPSQSPSPSSTPTASATRTPAPTNTASPSPSPTSTPSASPTPSRTPSPSGPCITVCQCDSFTCQLAFDVDDDENTLSEGFVSAFPNQQQTENIIYVDDEDNLQDDVVIQRTRVIYRTRGGSTFDATTDITIIGTISLTDSIFSVSQTITGIFSSLIPSSITGTFGTSLISSSLSDVTISGISFGSSSSSASSLVASGIFALLFAVIA